MTETPAAQESTFRLVAHHIGITVSDLSRSIGFYRDLLGFNVAIGALVILPMQLSGRSGKRFFQPSSSGTAEALRRVKSNSKSSPSVSAATSGGLAEDSVLA